MKRSEELLVVKFFLPPTVTYCQFSPNDVLSASQQSLLDDSQWCKVHEN